MKETMRKPRFYWNRKETLRLVQLYLDGADYGDIEDELGASHEQVMSRLRFLRKQGCNLPKRAGNDPSLLTAVRTLISEHTDKTPSLDDVIIADDHPEPADGAPASASALIRKGKAQGARNELA